MKSIHILISGRVQGVGFRFFTRSVARKLHISGTVENISTGRVEIFAAGTEKALDQFLDILKYGNMLSDIKDIEVEDIDALNVEGFEILR